MRQLVCTIVQFAIGQLHGTAAQGYVAGILPCLVGNQLRNGSIRRKHLFDMNGKRRASCGRGNCACRKSQRLKHTELLTADRGVEDVFPAETTFVSLAVDGLGSRQYRYLWCFDSI